MKTPLSAVQKDRLVQAARLTAEAYDTLLEAQAVEAHQSEITRAAASYNADVSQFEQLRMHRGLVPGDRIRILEDGSFKGREAVIREWSWAGDGRLQLDWMDGSPCRNETEVCFPRATEVELVEAGQ